MQLLDNSFLNFNYRTKLVSIDDSNLTKFIDLFYNTDFDNCLKILNMFSLKSEFNNGFNEKFHYIWGISILKLANKDLKSYASLNKLVEILIFDGLNINYFMNDSNFYYISILKLFIIANNKCYDEILNLLETFIKYGMIVSIAKNEQLLANKYLEKNVFEKNPLLCKKLCKTELENTITDNYAVDKAYIHQNHSNCILEYDSSGYLLSSFMQHIYIENVEDYFIISYNTAMKVEITSIEFIPRKIDNFGICNNNQNALTITYRLNAIINNNSIYSNNMLMQIDFKEKMENPVSKFKISCTKGYITRGEIYFMIKIRSIYD